MKSETKGLDDAARQAKLRLMCERILNEQKPFILIMEEWARRDKGSLVLASDSLTCGDRESLCALFAQLAMAVAGALEVPAQAVLNYALVTVEAAQREAKP